MKKVRILDSAAIAAKLDRMAYEIAERNYGAGSLVLAGISQRGGFVAARLAAKLKEISDLKAHLLPLEREARSGVISLDGKKAAKLIAGQRVVIVDDVLYSGHTLFHALMLVMVHKPSQVQTALLIDRGHRSLPLSPDFVGLVLATTLKQHVEVQVSADGKRAEAFLQ